MLFRDRPGDMLPLAIDKRGSVYEAIVFDGRCSSSSILLFEVVLRSSIGGGQSAMLKDDEVAYGVLLTHNGQDLIFGSLSNPEGGI